MNSKSVLWIILKSFSFRNYLFPLLLLLFIYNGVLQAQSVQTNGPNGGDVRSFAIIGNNILAGTFSGNVFLSSNNGTNWSLSDSNMHTVQINTFVVSDNNIFAGTMGGVILSSDYGK